MISVFCVWAKGQTQPQNRTYNETELWPSSSPQTTNTSTESKEQELWPSSSSTSSSSPVVPQKTVPSSGQPSLVTAVTPVAPAKTPSNSSYIVKTKGVQPVVKVVKAAASSQTKEEEVESGDFMTKNFRYQSMCDWKEGMRFMVVPEKYDMLVNTFCDAATGKEVSSNRLRHKIMVYKGHEDLTSGRVHVNFTCEDDKKNYYYELPNGTFDDYCFGKLGVPTLAYLGDVDKARRSFPVKIIVEDDEGNQFYQNVAMSKINCGMRDDEFSVDNEKFLFQGSFDYNGGKMSVSSDIKSYLNQTVHTTMSISMSSKGSGKVRDVKVPRFTGFIIDEINPIKDSPYYTLTLRETDTRRIYYKDVLFKEEDLMSIRDAKEDDYFGHIFGMGEGALHKTSLETRTAIREGRVIPGMSEDEVLMAVGEPFQKVTNKGVREWLYQRSNGVLLVVQFNSKGKVSKAGGRATKATKTKASTAVNTAKKSDDKAGATMKNATPVE